MDIQETNTAIRNSFHNSGVTGKNIIFAVLDTGVNETDVCFGKIIRPCIFNWPDRHGHGTLVANLLLQWCPDAKVLAYNVINGGTTIALNDVLRRAKRDKSHQYIVNISMTYSSAIATLDPIVIMKERAINRLVENNIPVVVAAGNDGEERLSVYPSCFQSPICVSAIDKNGNPSRFTTWHKEVDFCEHGTDVPCIDINGDMCVQSGTSLSSPIVAGKVGLLYDAYKKKTGEWISEQEMYNKLCGLAISPNGKSLTQFGRGFIKPSIAHIFNAGGYPKPPVLNRPTVPQD